MDGLRIGCGSGPNEPVAAYVGWDVVSDFGVVCFPPATLSEKECTL